MYYCTSTVPMLELRNRRKKSTNIGRIMAPSRVAHSRARHIHTRSMRAVTTSPVAIAPAVTRSYHAARPAPRARAVARAFGSWKKKQEEEPEDDDDEAKINMRGLTQLIKMGLGTISGDITEINLYVTIRARETRLLPFGGLACCPGRWRVLTISSDSIFLWSAQG